MVTFTKLWATDKYTLNAVVESPGYGVVYFNSPISFHFRDVEIEENQNESVICHPVY